MVLKNIIRVPLVDDAFDLDVIAFQAGTLYMNL